MNFHELTAIDCQAKCVISVGIDKSVKTALSVSSVESVRLALQSMAV